MTKPLYAHEKTLFIIAAVISGLIWIGLIFSTRGVVLAMLPFFFLGYLFVQSRFISTLRGTGALVSDSQFPDIQKRIKFCADKIGMKTIPKVYIMHGDGMFNAFATQFLRNHYLILLSDIIDAMADDPDALNFYIGHEMGHIDRRHLFWEPFISFALLLPLLGYAYSRAREYTCDMYGALCCSADQAQKGLAALAVGGKRYKTLNMKEYIGQTQETSGFWMSFHELVSTYPFLVKRVARVSPHFSENIHAPHRNPLAFILAIFIPQFKIFPIVAIYISVVASAGMYASMGIDHAINSGVPFSSVEPPPSDYQVPYSDPAPLPPETAPSTAPASTADDSIAKMIEELSKELPKTMDAITTWDKISLDYDGTILYSYKVNVPYDQIDFESIRQQVYQGQIDYWCKDPGAQAVRQGKQVRVAHSYKDMNDTYIGEVFIDTYNCPSTP